MEHRDQDGAEEALLFSYGTLQDEPVQFSCFGRRLPGTPDVVIGYRRSMIEIADPEASDGSKAVSYPILDYTGSINDEVVGQVFRLTASELASADTYEGPDYQRIQVQLQSGTRAWVYVRAETRT